MDAQERRVKILFLGPLTPVLQKLIDGVSYSLEPVFSFDKIDLCYKLYALIIKKGKNDSGLRTERYHLIVTLLAVPLRDLIVLLVLLLFCSLFTRWHLFLGLCQPCFFSYTLFLNPLLCSMQLFSDVCVALQEKFLNFSNDVKRITCFFILI